MNSLKDIRVKARKRHTCLWCSKPILPSETYRYQVYVDGGVLLTSHECDRCAPYFKEAFEGDFDYDNDDLSEDFIINYMHEQHPEILKQWEVENTVLKETGKES